MDGYDRGLIIARALSRSPSLETVHASYMFSADTYLTVIAENPNLQRICIKSAPQVHVLMERMLGITLGAPPDLTVSSALLNSLGSTQRPFFLNLQQREFVQDNERLRSLVIYNE